MVELQMDDAYRSGSSCDKSVCLTGNIGTVAHNFKGSNARIYRQIPKDVNTFRNKYLYYILIIHLITHRSVKSWRRVRILWHVDPLLGGDGEIGNCIAAVTRQRPENNREMVFLRGPCRGVISRSVSES
jgi:hypothetical protein